MAQARQAGEPAGRQAAGLRRCLCRATSSRHYLPKRAKVHTLAPNSSKRPRGGVCSGVVCLSYGSLGIGSALFSSTLGGRRFGACETRALLCFQVGTAVQGTMVQSSVQLRHPVVYNQSASQMYVAGQICPSGGGEHPPLGSSSCKGYA
jgi:hypothetical protein